MDLLGIKGRVQTRNIEVKDEKTTRLTEMIAEKITFLSSKNKDKEE